MKYDSALQLVGDAFRTGHITLNQFYMTVCLFERLGKP